MKGKEDSKNRTEYIEEQKKEGIVTKNDGDLLVNSTIDSLGGQRYDSRAVDGCQGKKWEEFLSITSEILVHYMQYLKDNGEEI